MDNTSQPRPLPRRHALEVGISDNNLRTMHSRDGWTRLRRGHYLPPDSHPAEADRHRLLIAATMPGVASGCVLSHQSAAVLHRLALWRTPLNRVHVTRAGALSGHRTTNCHRHAAPIAHTEIVEIDGLAVTSLARTIADLARTLPYEEAVVAGDGACRLGLTPEEVQESLAPLRGTHGIGRARSVAGFLDGRSESAGESRSRAVLLHLGLPKLDLQHEVFNSRGGLIGRADFALAEHGVLGEFDGRIKYGRCLRPGQTPGDAVFLEKQREDRLRDEGWQVVRWTWRELFEPESILERFTRAMARGRDMRSPLASPPSPPPPRTVQ